MYDVTLVGASGRVGIHLVCLLSQIPKDLKVALVLRKPKDIVGILEDINSVGTSISFELISWEDLARGCNSRLIILLAGVNTGKDEKGVLEKKDPGGRLTQAYANKGWIMQFGQTLLDSRLFASQIVVVTNQSDLLAGLLRRATGLTRIFGFGNMLDSLRYRACTGQQGAQLVGFHSDRLFAAQSTLGDTTSIDPHAESKVKAYGSRISDLYKRSTMTNAQRQSGSAFGPALCLAKCIASYYGAQPPLTEVFNHLPNLKNLRVSSVGVGLPVRIGHLHIVSAADGLQLTDWEMNKLKEFHGYFSKDLQALEEAF